MRERKGYGVESDEGKQKTYRERERCIGHKTKAQYVSQNRGSQWFWKQADKREKNRLGTDTVIDCESWKKTQRQEVNVNR